MGTKQEVRIEGIKSVSGFERFHCIRPTMFSSMLPTFDDSLKILYTLNQLQRRFKQQMEIDLLNVCFPIFNNLQTSLTYMYTNNTYLTAVTMISMSGACKQVGCLISYFVDIGHSKFNID